MYKFGLGETCSQGRAGPRGEAARRSRILFVQTASMKGYVPTATNMISQLILETALTNEGVKEKLFK